MRSMKVFAVAAGFAGLLLPALSGQSEQDEKKVTFTWLMPLLDAADLLQQRSGKVVTYEDPLREWADELEAYPQNNRLVRLKRHTLALPEDSVSTDAAAKLNLGTVQRIVEAYHQQNPNGARFKVIQSEWGLHIVPIQVRNKQGELNSWRNPLDMQIEVPSGSRTAGEHLRALASAAGAAAGIRVIADNPHLDAFFAINHYMPRMGGYLPEDRQFMVFEWGTKGVTAREALISLLSRSCSTLTWHSNCVPNALKEGESACFLNVMPLKTGEPPRALQNDRCTDMRILPPPKNPQY